MHSKAFETFIMQLNATGRQKLEGYDPNLLDGMTEEERHKAEEIIWNGFRKSLDADIAVFLPRLKEYDGVTLLKAALKQSPIPSRRSFTFAKELYECTGDEVFVEFMQRNIQADSNNTSYIALASYCKPCDKMYELLSEAFINTEDDVARSSALSGILYNKGYLKDRSSFDEIRSLVNLRRKMLKSTKEERAAALADFNNGLLTND